MSPRRRLLVVLLGLLPIVVAGLLLLNRKPQPAPAPVPAVAPAPEAPPPAAAAPTLSAADAFKVVYPQPSVPVPIQGQSRTLTFAPQNLIELSPGRFALVSLGRDADGAHVNSGALSVAYLRGGALGLHAEGAPFVLEGTNGGYGEPPKVSVNRSLSSHPTLVVENGYMGQGLQMRSADLVQLGERPQVVARQIPLQTDDSGAGGACAIEGKIAAGVKDQLFAVVYRGAWRHAVTWRWENGKWVSAEPDVALDEHCPGR